MLPGCTMLHAYKLSDFSVSHAAVVLYNTSIQNNKIPTPDISLLLQKFSECIICMSSLYCYVTLVYVFKWCYESYYYLCFFLTIIIFKSSYSVILHALLIEVYSLPNQQSVKSVSSFQAPLSLSVCVCDLPTLQHLWPISYR